MDPATSVRNCERPRLQHALPHVLAAGPSRYGSSGHLRMQFSIQEIQHLGPGLRLGVGVRLGSATVLNRIGVVSCRRPPTSAGEVVACAGIEPCCIAIRISRTLQPRRGTLNAGPAIPEVIVATAEQQERCMTALNRYGRC